MIRSGVRLTGTEISAARHLLGYRMKAGKAEAGKVQGEESLAILTLPRNGESAGVLEEHLQAELDLA
jgi:hypothetical protein